MKNKLVFPLLFFILLSTLTEAQQAIADSLERVFITATSDADKRKSFNNLAQYYFTSNVIPAAEAMQHLEMLLEKKGDKNLSYLLILPRAVFLFPTDSISELRNYVVQYLQECRKHDDKEGYLMGIGFLAMKETYLGNHEEALRLNLLSLDYARDTLKDPFMVSAVYLSLGIFYTDQLDTLRSIEFNKKALETATENNHLELMASASNNLAMMYKDLGKLDTAMFYYRNAIRLFKQNDPTSLISNPLSNMAIIFRLKHEYDSAIVYSHQAISAATQTNYEESLGSAYYILAQTYRDISSLDSALIYYRLAEGLLEKVNWQSALRDFYADFAGFYASTGNHKLAYGYLQKASSIRDLIFNAENNKVLKEMDSKYQAGKKEQEILKQEEQIKRQRILKSSAMAIAGFFLLVVFFIFRSYRHKQKANTLLGIAKEKAEQSEKFKQQFLANMSHEIRTPMNAVMGMTNLLIEKGPRSDQFQYLEGIKKSSDHLLYIINDILDLTKIEAGKMELEQIDFSIRDVIDQVKQTLQYKADEKGLTIIVDIDPSIPEVVVGDSTRLNQVLMNLAGNAIKFTDKGSISIEVGETENNEIGFSIIDTGIGIPKDKLETIFENFAQANTSDTRKFGGTGLGLSISKQLVELMGGTIAIESEEGAGTTFSFHVKLPEGSAERMQKQKLSEQIDGTILSGLRILVVDDNEYNRIVVHDTLKLLAEVEIIQATDGREAIAQAEAHDFDVILMDVQMPLMNGYEATRHIRTIFDTPKNKTPVIALTASVIRSDLDKCRAAGMNDYVPKPFKTAQLIFAIANATGREIKFVSNRNDAIKQELMGHKLVTNLTYLEKFCDGDKKQMEKYIRMFTSTATDLIEKITTALSKEDYEEIGSQVHGYKTKWIMMGMNKTEELALMIERQCNETLPEKNIKGDVLELIEQIKAGKEELISAS